MTEPAPLEESYWCPFNLHFIKKVLLDFKYKKRDSCELPLKIFLLRQILSCYRSR